MKNTITLMHYVTLVLGFGLENVEQIVSIIALVISIALGIVGIVLKFKKYVKDGELSKEELEDLINDVNELKNKSKGE